MKSNYPTCFWGAACLIAMAFMVCYCVSKENKAHAETPPSEMSFLLSSNSPDIALAPQSFPAQKAYCLSCHQGIHPARPMESKMMQQILHLGEKMGDPNGCVVCHGGTPSEIKDKNKAHAGIPQGSKLKSFTPVPGALPVNQNTCGRCHGDHTYNVHRSIMNTDAGKMKSIMWSFGIGTENKDHIYGDHDIDDPDGSKPRFGTTVYKNYMKRMASAFPGQYPSELKKIPEVDLQKLASMPQQAAYTYLRNCNACHLSNKGFQDRGHFRGMGCAACHTLYGVEGHYEGNDPSIPKNEAGHLLVHGMQGTRKSPIELHGKKLSGIQVSTCAACHAAGRRIGHAYQGLMALGHSDHRGPFNEQGESQLTNGGYVFKYIRNDAHHRMDKNGKSVTGLLCQDCHTTNSMHGNGNIGSTTLATVEIECSDCHGTPQLYPWELPVGYGDEFGQSRASAPRGTEEKTLPVNEKFGMVYAKADGYLLSARGNPLGNVVRIGNKVLVHSETGHNFEVPVLKNISQENRWHHPVKARTAMVAVPAHMEKLECYACHSTWAAQYYGYKYVIDYTKDSADWLDSPEKIYTNGTTADYNNKLVMQRGAPTNWDYSHIRWENPPLGINGEGRVTPLVGVIQTISTVLAPDGKTIIWNDVAKTKAGYDAMELAPLQPHTASRESRDCFHCHGNTTAMGYGIDNGIYDSDPAIPRYADVTDVNGRIVSTYTRIQIQAIKDLHHDFMQLLNKDGKQVQTIDSHWPTSMPLTAEQRGKLSRTGTCLACHQDIPKGAIPIRMLGKIAEVANLSFASEQAHDHLLRENNLLISWVKALGIVGLILFVPMVFLCLIYRKKIMKFFTCRSQ